VGRKAYLIAQQNFLGVGVIFFDLFSFFSMVGGGG